MIIQLCKVTNYWVLYPRQLDLIQSLEGVSPLTQEAFQFWLTGEELQALTQPAFDVALKTLINKSSNVSLKDSVLSHTEFKSLQLPSG